MPILGTIASSYLQTVSSSYESIATVTVSSAQPTITFNNIPQTYTHLQIRAIVRFDCNGISQLAVCRVNSDTGSNYIYGNQYSSWGNGTGSVGIDGDPTSPISYLPYMPHANGNTSGSPTYFYSLGIINIRDYSNTNVWTSFDSLSCWNSNNNSEASTRFVAAAWKSTAAVTRLDFYVGNFVDNFMPQTQYALYGIKTA